MDKVVFPLFLSVLHFSRTVIMVWTWVLNAHDVGWSERRTSVTSKPHFTTILAYVLSYLSLHLELTTFLNLTQVMIKTLCMPSRTSFLCSFNLIFILLIPLAVLRCSFNLIFIILLIPIAVLCGHLMSVFSPYLFIDVLTCEFRVWPCIHARMTIKAYSRQLF